MSSYVKQAPLAPTVVAPEIARTVSQILLDVERDRERAVRRYAERFEGHAPERFTVPDASIRRAAETVPAELRDHIDRAADHVRRFADAQRATLADLELEVLPGIVVGHRLVPVASVGAYAPGGRHPLIASSLMTTLVPKHVGVGRVVACAPPHDSNGIAPAMLYAMSAGADQLLCVGGAHGVAAMAFGIEDVEPVHMIVGAGNAYVAEAKRQLFGQVGIDLLAGPTEILVIADDSANPELISADLVGQLEHGPTSAAWLVSTSRHVAEAVVSEVARLLPLLNSGAVAQQAWDRYGEVIVCDDEAEAVEVADRLAAEHVEVHTSDPRWFHDRLTNYGSLFLGDRATVAFRDIGIGTNPVLPTAGAARFRGGSWVGDFLKTLTYQHATDAGAARVADAIVAISRAEYLHGHARSAQERRERLPLSARSSQYDRA